MARSGAGGVASAVATALAILAVLAVLASASAAGVSYRGADDEPEAGPTPAAPSSGATDEGDEGDEGDSAQRFFPDGQVLTGDRAENANIEIPSEADGWTSTSGDIWDIAKDGQGSLGTSDPFVFEEGYCTQGGGDYVQAYIGFSKDGAVASDDPQGVLADYTSSYLSLLFEDYGREAPEVERSDIALSDGTTAYVSTFLEVPRDASGRCSSAVERRIMTFDSGEDVPIIYLTRNVTDDGGDVEGGLSDEAADVLLSATRIQQED